MNYKDKEGKTLYGFSQENLAKTNNEIKRTNKYMQVLIILFVVFIAILVSFLIWLEMNDIFTRLIQGSG